MYCTLAAMYRRLGLVLFSLFLICIPAIGLAPAQREPVGIVFDTDMGNDIDDTLALAILHALVSRHEARLLAVTTTKDNAMVAPAVDILNTFFGRPEIPIGVVKNGKTPENSPLLAATVALKNPDGSFVYPRKIQSGADAADAVSVLRDVLQSQPDSSVVLVQVGFSTNLARLLKADPELVQHKVRRLVAMAGNFRHGEPEYNIKTDIPAAQELFRQWPTDIVCSGFEVGNAVRYPARSIQQDYGYVAHHPVADAYRAYKKMPYDRPTWDLTAALYAVRPDEQYFRVSAPGTISVDASGHTNFLESPSGRHKYLIFDKTQRVRLTKVFRNLASQPPRQQAAVSVTR